jgi:hypothetical protein
LCNGRVTLDDAYPVTGRAQVISGGDARYPAANDDDIHALIRYADGPLTRVPAGCDMRRAAG